MSLVRSVAPSLGLLLAASSCRRASHVHVRRGDPPAVRDWGPLPRTQQRVREVVAGATRRPIERAGRRFADGAAWYELATARPIAGLGGVLRALDAEMAVSPSRDAVLLFGVAHDAPLQAEAFRALVSPAGLSLTHVGAEPLEADGGWSDVDAQAGDDGALGAYVRTGSRAAFARLAERHGAHDYASWKFDYAGAVTGLAVDARAGSMRLFGGDMPRAIRPPDLGDDELRLRELHCAHALARALRVDAQRAHRGAPARWRVALLWGDEHLADDAFPRFLERDVRLVRVHAVGGRRYGAELALLLPDPASGLRVERVRTTRADAGPERVVFTGPPGRLAVASEGLAKWRFVEVTDGSVEVQASAGVVPYRFLSSSRELIGGAEIPRGGHVEIDVDRAAGAIRVTVVEPE